MGQAVGASIAGVHRLVPLVLVLGSIAALAPASGLPSTAAATAGTVRLPAAGRPPVIPSHQWLTGRERYSAAVAHICSGALLFEQAHAIGTDAGARAAAQDIRQSARRRLARVARIPIPPQLRHLASRWLSLQRRLAESYATNWMRIHDAIEAAHTPLQRASLPRRLQTFLHAPDPLRRASGRLELALNVPDCTGGEAHP